MKVNFSREEYMLLCEAADYHGITPAWLVHHWVMEKYAEWLVRLKEQQEGRGSWDGSDALAHPEILSPPEP